MDLTKLNSRDDAVFMQITHPGTGMPLVTEKGAEPVGLMVVGQDSPQYQDADKAIANRKLKNLDQRRGKIVTSAEQIEADSIELFAACITGFKHVQLGKETLTYTPEAARHLLKSLPFVREQLAEFTQDRANFLQS